jgi:hypothetical protein
MATVTRPTKGARSTAASDPRLLPPDTLVPIPPRDSFNTGLSSAREATMLEIFGAPGRKTFDCSPATGSALDEFAASAYLGVSVVNGHFAAP